MLIFLIKTSNNFFSNILASGFKKAPNSSQSWNLKTKWTFSCRHFFTFLSLFLFFFLCILDKFSRNHQTLLRSSGTYITSCRKRAKFEKGMVEQRLHTCSISGGRIHCCRPPLTPGDRSESCGWPVQIYVAFYPIYLSCTHPRSKYNPSSSGILFIRIDCNLEFADPCKVSAKNAHVSIPAV